jgi:peptide/nickel transport system substrate-binding protein
VVLGLAVSRPIVVGVAVIVLILLLLGVYYFYVRAPTAPTTTPTPTTSPPLVKRAEQIIIGVTDKVTDLDPANAYDFFTWEVLSNVMEGLVKYEPGTLNIIPGLAERWEVSGDGRVWTFYLRSNLKFADGTPLTARDVVRSVERVMKINGDPAWLVTEFVDRVEAKDDRTVVFYLKNPVGYFLAVLATPPYFPVHPSYKPDAVDSDQTAGGAGPYRIARFIRDVEIILEENPYYYGPKPETKRVVIRFYRDATGLRLALERGEIDIAWRTLLPQDVEVFRKTPGYKVVEVPGTFIRYVVLNTKMPPFDNKVVRQAIAAVMDRSDIINRAIFGSGTPLYSLIPIGMMGHLDVFKDRYGDKNIELARNLLRQAGYSETNKLKIELWYTPTHYGDTEIYIATVIKEQLEATGLISVELKSAEWATYVQFIREGRLGIYLLGWYPDYLDPDNYMYPFLHSKANKWAGSGYANTEMDRILEEAQITVDMSKRGKLYEQAQKILAEDVPYIPLFQGKLYIVVREGVTGIKPSPTMLFFYSTVYKEVKA